jgi:hypothetical protein
MKEILGENMVFHTRVQITNNNSTKLYDNLLVIRVDNFDNFLNKIDGEEEIEEIKFKLKKKNGEPKRFYAYKIKIDKTKKN